ncbi:chemotaxis protein CheW [Methyloraptor flagellatus]|uniref:Chemotaxis protein CheW n=1 Tax=Methyloraptor flagellatus TaxID=3162530 RepID=A0AAU7XFT6_9HYPH
MKTGGSETQFVTFALGSEVFAVPVSVVREILDHEEVFRIPSGPAYLLGLRNVRGQGVPVIDLRLRLGLSKTEPTPHTRVLVVDVPVAGRVLTLGLVADRVFEVAAFTSDQIETAPDIGVAWNSDYIEGVVRRDASFAVIISLARLLTETEVVALAATQGKAQAA